MTAPAPSPAAFRWAVWFVPAVLALALFAPAIGFDFVNYDDNVFVYNNPHVTGGLTWANAKWAFTAVHEQWWLPLLWLSYMLDSSVFGLHPWGYHLVNVLLHAVNAGLLGWFLFRLTGCRWRSLLAAGLFAVHPLRVESVAWITERKDVLSGLFFFLALLAYLRHVRRPRATAMAWVSLWLLLGLMSKASVIVLPVLLLLLDYWPLRRADFPKLDGSGRTWLLLVAEKAPLFLLAAVFACINLHTHISGSGTGQDIAWFQRLALIPGNYWSYLHLVVWPVHLSVFYPENDAIASGPALLALAGLAVVTLVAIRNAPCRPHLLVGWLWFLIALLPVIRGVRLGFSAHADRFTYLPSIGLGIALVWQLCNERDRRSKASWAGALALAFLTGICAWQTQRILPRWEDSIRLMRASLEATPDSPVLLYSLGSALIVQDRDAEAVPYFQRALELKPNLTPAWANWALALNKLGRIPESQAVAARGLDWEVDSPTVNHMLASFLLGRRPPKPPRTPPAPIAVADLGPCMERGELPALFMFRDLCRALEPELRQIPLAFQLDYVARWRQGEHDRAWPFFLYALAANPLDVSLLNNAAWLLATDPEPPTGPGIALVMARRAQRLAPPNMQASVLDTLAAALAANGQFTSAEQTALQAIDLAARAQDTNNVAQIQMRLETYQRRQPWREAAP